MKFEQLEQFIKIIDEGSISKAALSMHMAQSSLSISIKKLEDELGTSLIKRSSDGVSMTEDGKEVYRRGKIICSQVEDLRSAIKGNDNAIQNLSIANNYSVIGKDIFLELYNDCKNKGYGFRIFDCSINEAIAHVSSGEADIGLLRFPEANKADHIRHIKRSGLVYKPIARKVICALVGEKNPFYRLGLKKIKPEQLVDFPFVGYYDEETELVYNEILEERTRGRANISIGSIEHLREILRGTDAFSLDVYKEASFNSEESKGIKFIPLQPKIYSEFGWIMKKNMNLTDIATDYIERIDKRFKVYDEEPRL